MARWNEAIWRARSLFYMTRQNQTGAVKIWSRVTTERRDGLGVNLAYGAPFDKVKNRR